VYGFLVIALYLVAAGLAAWSAARRGDGRVVAYVALPAVLAHGAWLALTLRSQPGFAMDIADSLSLFGLVLGLIGSVLSLRAGFRGPASLMLVSAAALAVGTGSLSTLRVSGEAGWPLFLHVTLSALAFGLLAAAAVLTLILAFQDAALKGRTAGDWLQALPPIESMERAVFAVLTVGFICLSATLLVGALFITDLFSQRLVHKVVLAVAAWAIFGALLYGRVRHGWRGRQARRLVLGGFALLAMSYFLTKFILEVVLGRHWG